MTAALLLLASVGAEPASSAIAPAGGAVRRLDEVGVFAAEAPAAGPDGGVVFGFGATPDAARADAAARARALDAARARQASHRPEGPAFDRASGALLRVRGARTAAALDAALAFARGRDRGSVVAALAPGEAVIRLPGSTSAATLAAAAQGLSVPGHALAGVSIEGGDVVARLTAAVPEVDAPGPADRPSAVDSEDAPEPR